MLNPSSAPDNATLEQCVDEIDGCIDTLGRYSETVLAFALRVHLTALLRAMLERQVCSQQELRQFLLELEHEALGVDED